MSHVMRGQSALVRLQHLGYRPIVVVMLSIVVVACLRDEGGLTGHDEVI